MNLVLNGLDAMRSVAIERRRLHMTSELVAIARSIVEAHGGRVSATDNREGGATLWFTLPTAKT